MASEIYIRVHAIRNLGPPRVYTPDRLEIKGSGLTGGSSLEILVNGAVAMTLPIRPDGTVSFDQRPLPPTFNIIGLPVLGANWSAPMVTGSLVHGWAQDELEIRYS